MKCLTGSVPDTGTPWKSKCESSYEKRSCGLIWLPERAMSLLRTDGLSGKFRPGYRYPLEIKVRE